MPYFQILINFPLRVVFISKGFQSDVWKHLECRTREYDQNKIPQFTKESPDFGVETINEHF